MSTTPNLLISHIAASQNQKEVTANTAFDEFDEALCNLISIPLVTGNNTLATNSFLYDFVMKFTGGIASDSTVICPANAKPFVVSNQTTGGFNLTIKVGTGTATVIIPPDSKYYFLYSDGLNSVFALRSASVSPAAESIPTDARTTTTETVNDSDRGYLVTFSNASATAASIAQAGNASRFLAGWFCQLKNIGAGLVTLTPATSTVDGAATVVLRKGESLFIISDGTNYITTRGKIVLPQYTVANLPASALEGDVAYATNGLKAFETTGNGTGVPVYFSQSNPSIGGLWRVFSTDAQVQA